MKRRSFILVSALSLLGFGTFTLIQRLRNSVKDRVLAQPKFLSMLCDSDTIRTLGRAYLKLKPDETRNEVLINDLLAEESPKDSLKTEDMTLVESQIEKRIKQDFDADDIVLVQGWVLSITEARQCAFFSILNS
ncbi:MAG TPA: hypothetical protein VKQ08_05715 [Cyclobacteriaceae bacterium]|nr:hypothetical protein [Cyclobacteriaceae bacterium]